MIKKVTLIKLSPHTNRYRSHLYESINSIAKGQSVIENKKKMKIHSTEVEIKAFEIRIFLGHRILCVSIPIILVP